MNELSRLRGSERYGACIDVFHVKQVLKIFILKPFLFWSCPKEKWFQSSVEKKRLYGSFLMI